MYSTYRCATTLLNHCPNFSLSFFRKYTLFIVNSVWCVCVLHETTVPVLMPRQRSSNDLLLKQEQDQIYLYQKAPHL